MAQHDDATTPGSSIERHAEGTPGTAVVTADAAQNPGFPPHEPRVTDVDPKADKKAERQVTTLFFLSLVGSIFAVAAYIAFPIVPGDLGSVRLNTALVGGGIALALLGIGFGTVHWAKALMRDTELVEQRHPSRGKDETTTSSGSSIRVTHASCARAPSTSGCFRCASPNASLRPIDAVGPIFIRIVLPSRRTTDSRRKKYWSSAG